VGEGGDRRIGRVATPYEFFELLSEIRKLLWGMYVHEDSVPSLSQALQRLASASHMVELEPLEDENGTLF